MKKIYLGLIILILVILLFPMRFQYKDGGTVEYRAILYKVIKWHQLNENYEGGLKTGTDVYFFPMSLKDFEYFVNIEPSVLTVFYEENNIKASLGSYKWCNTYNNCEEVLKSLVSNFESYPSLDVLRENTIDFDANGNIDSITVYKDSIDNIYTYSIEYNNTSLTVPSEEGSYLYNIKVLNEDNYVEYIFRINVSN